MNLKEGSYCPPDRHRLAEMVLNATWTASHLDCGTVLSTKRNIAFSDGSWILFLMIHMNWATVMSEGTKYFLLSISTIWDPETFSTMTCKAQLWRWVRLFGTGMNASFGEPLWGTGLRQASREEEQKRFLSTTKWEAGLLQHSKGWFYNCTEPIFLYAIPPNFLPFYPTG